MNTKQNDFQRQLEDTLHLHPGIFYRHLLNNLNLQSQAMTDAVRTHSPPAPTKEELKEVIKEILMDMLNKRERETAEVDKISVEELIATLI